MKTLYLTSIVLTVLSGSSCGKEVLSHRRKPQFAPAPSATAPEEEAPPPASPEDPVTAKPHSPQVNDFLRSDVGQLQTVRKDYAEILLTNSKGDIAVAGVTRSSIVRDYMQQPSLGGDVFFSRYSLASGWDVHPVQVPVQVPPLAAADPKEQPKPLPEPIVSVKGGRLLDSGKALVVGELVGTLISDAQLNIEETRNASRNIFLSVFGAGENGMMKSIRYGLDGENIVAGTADGPSTNTLLIAGSTKSGLRLNSAQKVVTQSTEPANFIAEIDENGGILRNLMWPLTEGTVANVASNSTLAFAVSNRSDGHGVTVRGLRLPKRNIEILALPEKEVCASAGGPSKTMRAASISVNEREVVVAVEITDSTVASGTVLPCFEVFQIRQAGTLVSLHEQANLPELPSAAGTVNAQLVQGGRIMLMRSRENTDSRGRSVVVSSFIFNRPLKNDDYESRLWSLTRPKDWYADQQVDGLNRMIKAVVRPKVESQQDIVWVLSNDRTVIEGQQESLVHIGTYSTLTKAEQK